MKRSFKLLLLVALMAFADWAAATAYVFSSPNYTFASGSYTTSMHLSGTLVTTTALPPNLPYSPVDPYVASWTFFDGLITYTNLNTSNFSGFYIATDASGNISGWGISMLTPAAPHTVGETVNELYVAQSGGGAAGGYNGTCASVSGGSCNGYTPNYLGIVEGSAGTWKTLVPVYAPALDWRMLAVLAMLVAAFAYGFHRMRRPRSA